MPKARGREGRGRVQIPAARPHQREVLDDDVRFKAMRWGRRRGKSRLMFRAAITGHGPKRIFEGISKGWPILWLAPDYPQSKAIWDEEIRPRFIGARGVKLNDSPPQSVELPNGGKLEIRSAEAVDGVRGKKFKGLLIDEAAFMEFFYAWRRVLRPTLTDYQGWAIVASTTEVGSDFNQLIREIDSKDKSRSEWKAWHGKTKDNPYLDQEELRLLYAEYPAGGSDAAQELDAELLDEHGTLFKREYFHSYQESNRHAMWVKGLRYPFLEIVFCVDLASSLKEKADYFCVTVYGLHETNEGLLKVGVLDMFYDHMEGPDQLDKLEAMSKHWAPNRVKIEATQYQLTSVQHLARRCPHLNISPCYPDKDKRSRAVPWAAAMSRGDVFWPVASSWLDDAMKQHLKFPNGKDDSRYIEDHDDIVDTGSLMGEELTLAGDEWKVRKVLR